MATKNWVACLGLIVGAGLPWAAHAQYYAPPPGYDAPPQGYYAPPQGYYAPPPRYQSLGGRCEVRLNTRYGPQREICEIVRPRPVGRPCACPPPPPPPGYAPGPFINGRVIP